MNAIDASPKHGVGSQWALGTPNAQEPLGVPVSRVFRVLRRRGWIAVLVVIAVMIGTTTVVMQMAPTYTSQAAVLVEGRRSQLTDLQISSAETEATNAVQTQIDIMRSPDLMRQVVRSLHLTDLREFSTSEGLMGRLRGWLGTTAERRTPTVADRELTAAQILAGRFTFNSSPRSNVVQILVETEDAGRSATIVNELAARYLTYSRDRKYATLQRTVSWFQTRLAELAMQVQDSQAALQRYRAANNLTDLPINPVAPASDRPSVQAQQLADLNRQLSDIVGERVRREAQVAEVGERLRRQRHPGGSAELPANLVAELNAYRTQENTLREAVAHARRGVAQENVATSQMAGLLAQAQTSRAIYDSFLSRATQLANAEGVQEADAELLSSGSVPNGPSSPKRGRLLGVTFGFALLLGLSLTLLVDRLRAGLGSLADVESELGVKALTIVPRVPRGSLMRSVTRHPEFENAMQSIQGKLALAELGVRQGVIVVTSAIPQEGKSVLALGLAESAARAGLRVLLIDADLRRPTLKSRLGLRESRGLFDLLSNGVRLDEVVTMMPSGLFVLPSSGPAANAQQLLGSVQMRSLLRAARTKFDVVLIDTPPILPMVDAMLVAQHADTMILAARWEHTPTPLLNEAVRLLHQSGAHLAGIVLTRARLNIYAKSSSEGGAYLHRRFRRYYRVAA